MTSRDAYIKMMTAENTDRDTPLGMTMTNAKETTPVGESRKRRYSHFFNDWESLSPAALRFESPR